MSKTNEDSYEAHNLQLDLRSRATPSESGSDDSLESCREKIENLKDLVCNLNRQLNLEKTQNQTIETLTNELRKEQERNQCLETQLKRYKEFFLELTGKSDFSSFLEMSSTMDPSSATMEVIKLKNENESLKSELKYLLIDPEKMDELLKENDSLRKKLKDCLSECEDIKAANLELKKILAGSSDQKIQEISKLWKQITEMKKKSKLNDMLCETLSAQIRVLQQRLQETNQACEQILGELEKQKHFTNQRAATSPEALIINDAIPQHETNLLTTSANSQPSAQDKLRKLESQIKQLYDANQKWQQYHEKQEAEFCRLQKKLEEKEKLISEKVFHLSESQQEQMDRLIQQYKKQIGEMETEKQQLLDENRQLRMQLEDALSRQYKSVAKDRQRQDDDLSDKDRVKVLEIQVNTIIEDFENEKLDRQRAEARANDLEKELQVYKRQLASLQRCSHHHRSIGLLQCDDIDVSNVEMPQSAAPPVLLMGRGVNQAQDNEGYDEVDCMPANQKPVCLDEKEPTSKRTPVELKQNPDVQQNGFDPDQTPVMTSRKASLLKCPSCEKKFSADEHFLLLKHMETCLK